MNVELCRFTASRGSFLGEIKSITSTLFGLQRAMSPHDLLIAIYIVVSLHLGMS